MYRKLLNYTLIVLTIVLFSGSLINVGLAYTTEWGHWKANSTYWYNPGNDFTSDEIYGVTVADNQWNGIQNRSVYFADTGQRCLTKSYTQNGVNEIFKNNMGATYLAQTSKWTNLYGITGEADIVINDYYWFSSSTPPLQGFYHLPSVMTHEMGHICGLGHSGDNTAVMYASFGVGEVRYQLTSDDIAGYHAVY